MQTIVLQKFENPKKVWGVVMWTSMETLWFVHWLWVSIPTVNIFCTFFKSFGLLVKKWVFKLKFNTIIFQHDSLQSRTEPSSKSVYNPEESRKLLVCCSQFPFWLVSFLLPWWPGLSSHTVNKKNQFCRS